MATTNAETGELRAEVGELRDKMDQFDGETGEIRLLMKKGRYLNVTVITHNLPNLSVIFSAFELPSPSSQ